MENPRLLEIRKAEKESHLEAYASHVLFAKGSWLAKPVKSVMEILPLFADYREFRALDLGCGVGRNSIPVARYFSDRACTVDCVDILDYAVERLTENSVYYGVADAIHGMVSTIEDYEVRCERYDLVLAISALEHVASQEIFCRKLVEIREGLRSGGIVCLVINSNVSEQDKEKGRAMPPQFEVNWKTAKLQACLTQVFENWEVLKETVVHQKYDIPRSWGTAELETDVVTFVARKQ